MPTYEYKCESCGHHFEKRQSMSDKPVKTCPKCGQPVRRVISGGTGVIIKCGSSHSTGYSGSSSPTCCSGGTCNLN
jgi:putative FmdB family regulatory protein